eukprot:s3361_g1.t1
MYLRPIALSEIGDRTHGVFSVQGVKVSEKGPMTKQELYDLVDKASERAYFSIPTGPNPRQDITTLEYNYGFYFNRSLRHFIGRKRVTADRKTHPGIKCDEAGWVNLLEYLHYDWIFGHEREPLGDNGYCSVAVLERRVNMMIKVGWSEFLRSGKVRWQLLCIVLDKDSGPIDDKLIKDYGLNQDEVQKAIEDSGEVFIAPIAVRAPSAHSMKVEGFKLDADKIYHPLTTQLANEFQYCYHVTELKLLIDIIEGGLRPGGETGGRTHVFFNPFAPWDDRYKNILGGELTHLGTIRVALVFNVNNLIGFNGMVTASGQIVVGGNVPFSEVEGAWYQNNRYEWIRLLVPAGELQMIRATKEPAEIATRGTVLKIAREVYDDINPDDNIPFYEEFVKDLNELEGRTGTLGFNSGLRNRLVTFIAENYIPKAAGKVICPACLTETPNNLAICVKCTGSLISFGERTSPYPEAESPGEPRPQQPQDADVGDEDVHMDKDEIDRLARYRLFYVYMVNAPAKSYVELVKNSGNLPEYDTYVPFVGEDEHGELREPTIDEYKAAFYRNAKGGLFGGRDIEMYLRGIEGTKNLCKIMKYIIQVGITPEFIAKKLTDIADADEDDRPDIRREVTNFIRKMISGAFAVRSYDYFRVTPPDREDHIHMDPVSLACAAVERGRTFAVLYTLNKIGLGMPPALAKIWEGKLKSSQTSAIQLERNIDMLDPNDRPDAREYMRAIEDTTERGEGTPGSGQTGPSQKKARRQKSDAGGGSSSSRRPTES